MSMYVPPSKFSYHDAFIVRSALPSLKNFSFIKSIGVRHSINLGQLFPQSHEVTAAKVHGFKLKHMPINTNASIDNASDINTLIDVVHEIDNLRRAGSLVYIYDTTSNMPAVALICSLLRRLEGWSLPSAVREFFYIIGDSNEADYSSLIELIALDDATLMKR